MIILCDRDIEALKERCQHSQVIRELLIFYTEIPEFLKNVVVKSILLEGENKKTLNNLPETIYDTLEVKKGDLSSLSKTINVGRFVLKDINTFKGIDNIIVTDAAHSSNIILKNFKDEVLFTPVNQINQQIKILVDSNSKETISKLLDMEGESLYFAGERYTELSTKDSGEQFLELL